MSDVQVLERWLDGEGALYNTQFPGDLSTTLAGTLNDAVARLLIKFEPQRNLFEAVLGYGDLGGILAWDLARKLDKLAILATHRGGCGTKIISSLLGEVLKGKKVLAVTYFL